MLADLLIFAFDFLPKPVRVGCYTLMVLFLPVILIVWLSDRW